ncbi:MAG: tetratricopeptide repeat protein [bacterium]|nr:tetratricopeptide repeat protein [bacterium]
MAMRVLLIVFLAFPLSSLAQKKQIQELQRDMALLQDEIRQSNQRLAALTLLVEETLDRVNSTATAVAVLEQSMQENVREQQKQVAAPMAALGAQVDTMAREFSHVRESIAEINVKVSKVQTQMTDLRTTMTVMQAPPAAPGEGGLPPTASAETLFNNAQRDQSGGKLDIALAQYLDFLKYFPNTDLAPVAQYHIGDIYYTRGEYKQALSAFDLVLERYPENEKTPDAMYMKAMSLIKTGSRRGAGREFRALVKKHPNTELAEKAAEELKKMGYSAP